MRNFHIAAVALAGFWFGLSGTSIAADNSIKQVQVRRDGEQVLLKVQMAAPLKALPGNWSVVEPPRVVIDFPETDNQTGQTLQQVATGDLKSLNLVQTEKADASGSQSLPADQVLDGNRRGCAVYQTSGAKRSGQSGAGSQRLSAGGSAKYGRQAGRRGRHRGSARYRVSPRRGRAGNSILVDLTDGTVPIDIRRTATGLTVELRDVELPDRLQNKRDVNDFATPVTMITSRAAGNLTRLEVAARGRWFHQAHLANNQLVIEVKPIPTDDANKLCKAGSRASAFRSTFSAPTPPWSCAHWPTFPARMC
jgi:type IV pilus assembly protein PilQ